MTKVKRNHRLNIAVMAAAILCWSGIPAPAQVGPELQMAELTQKLHLSDQQTKQLTPIVAERDKQVKALLADSSMGNLQKVRKAKEIQTGFRSHAAKYLNSDQLKELDALQAERRAKLMGQ